MEKFQRCRLINRCQKKTESKIIMRAGDDNGEATNPSCIHQSWTSRSLASNDLEVHAPVDVYFQPSVNTS